MKGTCVTTAVVLALAGACAVAAVDTAAPAAGQPAGQINFATDVSFYGFGPRRPDWDALADPGNTPILLACLNGATEENLQALGLTDLADRLERLRRRGTLWLRDGRYQLGFPAVVGHSRAALQALVQDAAARLLPSARSVVQQLGSHLGDRQDMLYHVLWSLVLDSSDAWQTVETTLRERVTQGDTSMRNKTWLLSPKHPAAAGTNIDATLTGNWLWATWSTTTPESMPIFDLVRKHEAALLSSFREGTALGPEAREELGPYGLADEAGRPRLYVYEADSPASAAYVQAACRFASAAVDRFDVEAAAQAMGVPPGVAMVIAYHEVCWEVLGRLAAEGILEVPEIVSTPDVAPVQMARLVSLRLGGPMPFEWEMPRAR
jgi:hypothetical protein